MSPYNGDVDPLPAIKVPLFNKPTRSAVFHLGLDKRRGHILPSQSQVRGKYYSFYISRGNRIKNSISKKVALLVLAVLFHVPTLPSAFSVDEEQKGNFKPSLPAHQNFLEEKNRSEIIRILKANLVLESYPGFYIIKRDFFLQYPDISYSEALHRIADLLPGLQYLSLNVLKDGSLKFLAASYDCRPGLGLTCLWDVTDDELAPIAGFLELKALHLSSVGMTDKGFAYIALLQRLQSLKLSNMEEVTSAGLAHLRSLSSLQELYLVSLSNLGDEGLAHLRGLLLQKLWLWRLDTVTDTGFTSIGCLRSLQELILCGLHNVTGHGLAHLNGLATLQRLGLSDLWGVKDDSFDLRGLRRLQWLLVCNLPYITDAALASIGCLQNLQSLELERLPEVSDFECLRSLQKLRWLKVNALPRLSDDALKPLNGFVNLQELILYGLPFVTEARLAFFWDRGWKVLVDEGEGFRRFITFTRQPRATQPKRR
jgi:hypothetical protein